MRRLFFLLPLCSFLTTAAIAQDATEEGPSEAQLQRYHLLLERNPQRGTAFDLLYQQYLDAGRLDELVAHYEQKTQQNPSDAAAQIVLGLIQERRHQYDQALAAFDRAAEQLVGDYRPHAYRAALLARLYRADEAIAAYQAALAANPPRHELLDIHKKLGRMHARQGQMDEALATWAALGDKFPGDRFAIEELARLLVEEEEYDAAIEAYEQLIELSRQDLYAQLVARIEIGQIQVRQGKLNTAIETFESCLGQVRPESWIARDIRTRIEQIFERSGDATGLVEYYRGRLEKAPDDLETRVQLASVLSRLGDREAALAEFRGVLDRAPTRRDIREKLIDELMLGDDVAAAIAETEAILEQEPGDVETLARLGHLYVQAGGDDASERAIETWRRISEIRADDPLLAVQAAELCRGAAKIGSRFTASASAEQHAAQAGGPFGQAALALYQEAVRRAPDAPQYHEYLGEFLYAIGRNDEAVAAWQQIAAPPRDTAENLRRLAEILASVDRVEEATRVLAEAIEKEPRRYELHAEAVELFVETRNFDAALRHVAQMEALADTPYLEEQALAERVAIYGAADRLVEELGSLEEKVDAGDASARDLWLAGMIAATQRRPTVALALLEKAIELAPEDVRLFRYKAEIHKQGGDLAGAAEQFRRLAELEPRRRTEHLRELVRLELDLGRADAAKEAAQRLVQLSGGTAEAVELLAEVHLRAGEVDEALKAYRRAVLDDPRNIESRLAMAGRLAQHQRTDEAIEHYWRAFQQAEDLEQRISIAGSLAEQHLIAGRVEQLVERLEQWRREQEDPFVATLCVVEVHTKAEDYATARRELSALSAERPDDVQVLAQLAALAEQMGDKQQAAEHLEAIVAKTAAPEPRLLQKLAGIYADLNQQEKVEAVWQRLAESAPDDKMLLTAIDRSLESGNFAAAAALSAPAWNKRSDDWRFGLRLAMAYWYLGQREAAADVARRISELPPVDNYAAAAAPAPQTAAYYAFQPPSLLLRLHRPVELQRMLAQSGAQATFQQYPMQYLMPDDLVGAQQIAFFMLHEIARAEGTQDKLVQAISAAAENDPVALRQLAWLRIAERDSERLEPLLARWIGASPDEAEPRVMLMMLSELTGRRPSASRERTEEELSRIRTQQEWLAEHRPDVARYTAMLHVQMLVQGNERDEARQVLAATIEQAQNINELTQVFYMANELQDAELLANLVARIEQLAQGKVYAAGPMNVGELLGQAVQMAMQQRNWDLAIEYFGRYMSATHPRALSSFGSAQQAVGGYAVYGGAYSGGYGMGGYGTGGRSGRAGSFPGPSPWLDAGRLQILTTLHRALASAGEDERLTEMIDERVQASEGIEQQSWRMCRVILHWRANEYDEAIGLLAALVEQSPGNAAARMVLAQAHSQLREHDKALAALESTHVAFGPIAKELEQLRMELAERAGQDETTKEAAMRLFGMRLATEEQAELAQVLQRLGLATRSDELLRRAVRSAGSDPAQLFTLMQQSLTTDPARATEIARMIIQQTSRSNQPHDEVSHYRQQALQMLANDGELSRMIEKAKEQLQAAPNSVELLEDLIEYYTAAGNQDEAFALVERIGAVRPNDPALRFRSAQMLLARGKLEEGLAQLDVVWKEAPQLILNVGHEFGQYYARAKKLDLLAEHIQGLKGSAHVLQNSYEVVNLVDNLRHGGGDANDVEGVIGVYEAVLEIIPDEQQEHIVQQMGSYLLEKNRNEDAYRLFKQVVWPAENRDPVAAAGRFTQTVYYGESGTMMTALMQVADLALELKKSDELQQEISQTAAEHKDWAPLGRLLGAMLERRAGREEPLVEIGRQWLEDDKLAESLGEDSVALRQELAACQSPEALRTAIDVWQANRSGHEVYDTDGASAVQVASLWMRLEEPQNARETLWKAIESDAPAGLPPRIGIRQTVQQKITIADALREHHFYLDALAAYDQAFEANFNEFDEHDYFVRQVVPQARQQMAQCVQQILSEQKEAALAALRKELEQPSPDLARFFAVVDPVTPDEQRDAARYGYYDPFGEPSPLAANDMKLPGQLLPSLLAAAHEAGMLEQVAEAAAARAAAAPPDLEPLDQDRLTALAILAELVAGRHDRAIPQVEAWNARLEKEESLAARETTWLLALAALEHERTRPIGRQLATAVARQAGAQGMLGRQQAAVTALTAQAGGASEDLAQLLQERRGDPRLRLQAALAQSQQKNYEAAVALLEGMWQTDADLLLPRLEELLTVYRQANRMGDLAHGLRSIRDAELQSNHSHVIARLFQRLPREEEHLESMVTFYAAAREFTGEFNSQFLASQWNSYLQGLPRNERTLNAYLTTLFGDAQGASELQQLASPAVDLAASLKQLEAVKAACTRAIEEHASWKVPGEILLAIVARREGDEGPLVEVAQRLASEPAQAAQLEASGDLLRTELSQCTNRPAIEAALNLWRPLVQRETGENVHASMQAADLLVKLDRRDEARQLLLAALRRPFSIEYNADADYIAQQKMQMHYQLAEALARNGFEIDALAAHAEALQTDLSTVESNSYAHQLAQQVHRAAAQLVQQILANRADAALDDLEAELRRADPPPDLAAFVTILDAPAVVADGSGQDQQPAAGPVKLLPDLLKQAREKGRLERLAEAVAAARERHAEQLSLVAVEALVAIARDDSDAAAASLQRLEDRLAESPAAAVEAGAYLAAEAALAMDATRDTGMKLLETIATSAAEAGNSARQGAAAAAFASALRQQGRADEAEALLQRMLAGDNADGKALLQLARVHFQAHEPQKAALTLARVWEKQPELALARFQELVPIYIAAGQTDELAAAMRGVNDVQLEQQHGYEVVSVLRNLGFQNEHTDEVVKLLEAAAEFMSDDRRENAYGTLADILVHHNRKEGAWDAYRRAVVPPTGRQDYLSAQATNLVNLSQELGKLGDVRAAAEAAIESHAAWKNFGELLLAMAELRAGDEQPLVKLAARMQADSTYAASLRNSIPTLRSELARCEAEAALKLAARLWELDFEGNRVRGGYNNDYRQFDELADVYVKLGERDKARRLWLDASTAMPNYYGGNYIVYHLFERREHIGPKLLSAGFALDALRLFEENRAAAQSADAEQFQLSQRLTTQRDARRQAILGVLAGELDAALAALEESAGGVQSPDVSVFFAVSDRPWTAAEWNRIPEHVRGDSPRDVQLLPALVRHAAEKQRLAPFAEAVAKKASQHPGNEHLQALAKLLPAWQGAEPASPGVLFELSRSDEGGIRALAILALGSLRGEDVTQRLVEAAGADGSARSMAIAALARQDTPAAAEAIGKLMITPDPALRRAAQEALARMHSPRAGELFRWETIARDDFEGGPSLTWQIVNHDPSYVSYEKAAGMLTVVSHRGSFHLGEATHKNVLTIGVPPGSGDLEITTCIVGFTPAVPFQQAALLAWNDDQNYLKFSYEAAAPDRPALALIPESGGQLSGRADVPDIAHNGKLWLRLTKLGNHYFYATSTDGETFHTWGDIPWGDGNVRFVGLTAASPGGEQTPEADVHFDFFEIRAAAGQAVLSPDQLAIAEVTAQLERQPEGAPLYFQRADLFARRARWKEAAADMVRGLALDPSDHWSWYRSAALALQLGDRAEYERYCREMLERFGAAEAAHIAERVAKVCLISREAVEAERAARLARVAVASDSRSNIYHWFLLCGGIASYRTGDDQGAISTLRQCLDRAGANGDPYSRSAGHSFLALALHRSGDAESAGRELAAAEALVAQLPPGDGTAEIVSWNDWIFSHVAIDEAKATIRAASSK